MTQRHDTAATVHPPAAGPAWQCVTGALFVDFGVNERGRRIRPPRARYECLLCQTAEGPVHGAEDVAAFTASIKTDHRSRCTQERRS